MKLFKTTRTIINMHFLLTIGCMGFLSTVSSQTSDGLITEEVSFNNGEIKLAGTLAFPSIQ